MLLLFTRDIIFRYEHTALILHKSCTDPAQSYTGSKFVFQQRPHCLINWWGGVGECAGVFLLARVEDVDM